MTVAVQIETSTAAGRKLITELRRYPDVVRFVEPDHDIGSLAATDSAKLAFDRLGEKFNCKFINKYT